LDSAEQRRSAVSCSLVFEVAERFGEVRLRVNGASMAPSIWPGDVLTVRRVGLAELRNRDVILYRRQEVLIAHRVIQVGNDHVITKGDTLLRHDPELHASDLVGQVVGIERNGRHIRPQYSNWQRAASSILGRSTSCLRIALRVQRLLRWPIQAATAE